MTQFVDDSRDVILAPFTEGQVRALTRWQERGNVHPFTCGGDHGETQRDRVLVATTGGWICRGCDYTQDWAFTLMLGNGGGAYGAETITNLRSVSRKLGYVPSRDTVRHLLDTVTELQIDLAQARRDTKLVTDQFLRLAGKYDELLTQQQYDDNHDQDDE